jgi:ATP-dependent helicase/nuclease subunit B
VPRTLYDITPLVPLVESGFVLLTPNQRLTRRIKSEWDSRMAASGAIVWEPIKVQPLESWLQTQWQLAVNLGLIPALMQIGPALALELWQQVIAGDERDSGSYSLLRPAAAGEMAGQARETLLRWQVDTNNPGVRQNFRLDNDCGTFLRWQDLFNKKLAAAGQGTAGDAVRQLLDCAGHLPKSRVVLLEFDDIPPLYRSVVNDLAQEVREISPAAAHAQQSVYTFADRRCELQAAARWAAATSREQPAATLGIVLTDMAADRAALEYLLRREFKCLGENYTSLPVNFSTGIPLDRAPVARDALAALAMSAQRCPVSAVESLLRSRFLKLPDADTPLANYFINRLYDAGREQLDTADLRYLASEVKLGDTKGLALGQILLTIAGMRELRQSALPSAWLERFSQVLEVWGWPGNGPLDSLEYQQVELWYRTLDEFRAYDAVCNPIGMEQALQLFRSSCARQMSQPQTEDASVQVLGPLEAAGLAFDQLWLCGMQAGRWPAAARPSPFIPQSLQRQLQMPHATAEREWTFAAGLIAQYTGSTSIVHASYCRLLDDVPELPSPLLEGFQPADCELPAAVDTDWLEQWQQRQVVRLEDNLAPAADAAELDEIGGGSGLLEDQSQCPFRAFARRRLRVAPLPEFSLALSAADRGSLLHDALNALWADINDHAGLLALNDAAQSAAVSDAAQAAIMAFPAGRRRQFGPAYWRLEGQRLNSLLAQWLALEKSRAEFAVAQRELDVSFALGPLQLRLRVDRIDRLADGSQMIIDYKSGVSRVQDWLGDRPGKPQLLLYGIAAPGEAAALAFGQVRPDDCKFVGLGRIEAAPGVGTNIAAVVGERMDASDWDSLNTRWRENLERLAAEFVSGEAQVDPLNNTSCTWCGLQPLCRVAAAGEETV